MSAYNSTTDSSTSVGSRWVMTKRASGKTLSSASSDNTCDGDLSRQGRGRSPNCSSLSTRFSNRYVDVKSASDTNHSEYFETAANAWKICDLKSIAMMSRHSIGSCVLCGVWKRLPTNTLSSSVTRGSSPTTVDDGGHGSDDSHRRTYRTFGSCASRHDSAVEPVRGSPSPNSGASTGMSSIPGWRRYQSST